MLEIAEQNVLVLGLGVSGRSAANHCAALGARVLAADERSAAAIGDLSDLDERVETALGAAFPDAADFDLVVPSPGVPRERYRERARRVWGDVELLYRSIPVPIVAITGTNGKSTTTALIEAMLRAAGYRVRAAGNIGEPALSLAGAALDFAVIEVSSFQLDTVDTFRPRVAVILNLAPDHLDRHGSFEAYAEAKARILACQRDDDVAVLNFDDEAVRGLAGRARGRVFPFRRDGPLEIGAWLDLDAVALCDEQRRRWRVSLDGMRLEGAHNRENALAALAAVTALGADPERAATALASFSGLPHRVETVATLDGVTWVNDSKATNPGAALRSLASFDAPIVWIAGGRAKGLPLAALAKAAGERARAAVLIGEAAEQLRDALANRIDVRSAASLDEAVSIAAELARPGDVVLLAPACASQDQFRDFAERGERFRAAVARQPGTRTTGADPGAS